MNCWALLSCAVQSVDGSYVAAGNLDLKGANDLELVWITDIYEGPGI